MENANSLSGYVHSIIRAAGFRDLRPRLRQVLLGEDEEVTGEHRHLHHHEGDTHSDDSGDEGDQQHGSRDYGQNENERTPLNRKASHRSEHSTDLAPLRSKVHGMSQQRVEQLAQQRDETRAQMKDDGQEPLLVTKVHRDDGTEAEVIVGQSTLLQTIFNSSNTLIGVGILSLPLGIKYAGWVIGIIGLVLSALVSKYTAGLLAKCIDVDSSLANFADIAYVAFGETGRVTTSSLITLELMVACVGLVILFADTLGSLIDGPSQVAWKVVCGVILTPLQFVPMKWLAFTSCLGVFCNLLIIIVGLIVGLIKPHSPGSLRDIATTHALPPQWRALPLSFGLIMALWSGHSVFPNIYRDMRHPHKYANGLNYIFIFVTSVDIGMAVVGYLLYGDNVLDEVTTNMIKTDGYARAVKVLVLILVAVVPITKFPLHAAPIVSTLEVYSRVDPRAALLKPNRFNQSKLLSQLLKGFFRLLVMTIAVVLAIAVPSFELISALLGGAFGFLICVIMPISFHLKMFQGQLSRRQITIDWMCIVMAATLGIIGTVWEFLPRGWMGL